MIDSITRTHSFGHPVELNSNMTGVRRAPRKNLYGRAFPHSRYDDPRGGRPSALERNILRYRSAEVSLYLFYTEEVRAFMLTNFGSDAVKHLDAMSSETIDELRLSHSIPNLLSDAEGAIGLSPTGAESVKQHIGDDRHTGKKLKAAFGRAIRLGVFRDTEANELRELLSYRNDIAHRIHLVMADISRDNWVADYVAYFPPVYKGDALDRLRNYRNSLGERTTGLILTLSMDGVLFEAAERVYEDELKRLDRLIQKQIGHERARIRAISVELDLSETELVDDLSPRFPANYRRNRGEGLDSGHLTKRGIETCYRLYDLGKSPIAVAYLMGMSLRAAQARLRGWMKAGGHQRIRGEIERYDLKPNRAGPIGLS